MSPRGQRLPRVTASEVVRALMKAGWHEICQESSHLRLRHADHSEDLTIPVHRGDMPKGTLNATIKQAGLAQTAFREFRKMRYTVMLTPEPDGGAVNVTVPALPGVLTWGSTSDEALTSAREAIELHLEGFVERGLPFPSDLDPNRRVSQSSRSPGNGCNGGAGHSREVVSVDVKLPAATIRTGVET